jgi:hypothetical protein
VRKEGGGGVRKDGRKEGRRSARSLAGSDSPTRTEAERGVVNSESVSGTTATGFAFAFSGMNSAMESSPSDPLSSDSRESVAPMVRGGGAVLAAEATELSFSDK